MKITQTEASSSSSSLQETRRYGRRYEGSTLVEAPAQQVFAFMDDHHRLSSQMSKPSWRMGGGRMETWVDAGGGRQVGFHIRLKGKILGVSLYVDEVAVRHDPPRFKVWETVGNIRLLIMGD